MLRVEAKKRTIVGQIVEGNIHLRQVGQTHHGEQGAGRLEMFLTNLDFSSKPPQALQLGLLGLESED